MFILMPNSEITEQQLFELPAINIKLFDSNGNIFLNHDINLSTIDFNSTTLKQTKPYAISVYDIPSSCICLITPLFDKNAFKCHNDAVLDGNIELFTTTENGIVDTDINNYNSLLWNTPTDTFDISIIFDDSDISGGSSGGGGGGGTSNYNQLSNKPQINNIELSGNKSLSSLGIQSALTFDSSPVQDSTNPVTSGGLYEVIGDINSVLEGVL